MMMQPESESSAIKSPRLSSQPESESSAIKRPRLSSPRNVCIIVQCCHEIFENNEYKFYILDRGDSYSGGGNDDEFVHMKPTLLFKANCPAVAFCALKSTLYMFEGDFHRSRSEGKYAGKFEITREILASFDYELKKHNLVPIEPMCDRKYSPRALPTPDGKHILVFSSQFSWEDLEDIYGDSFELYNVAKNSWRACDPLPRERYYSVSLSYSLRIEAYGFEGESHFRIRISGGLVFVLDLQSGKWERPISCNSMVGGYFLGIDGFHFTPTTAYHDIGHSQFPLHPPLSTFPDSHEDDAPMHIKRRPISRISSYMALLGHESDGVYDLGVVQARRPPSKIHYLNVILDIYSVNTVQFKRDVEQHKRDTEKYFEKYKRDTEKYKGKDNWKYVADREERPPLFKTTIATKTLKRLIDFDMGTYISGQLYLFSI